MAIDISKADKAAVLAALYNNARVQGMGFFHANGDDMTRAEAAKLLKEQDDFDYLRGRVMKIRIADTLDERLYDRDNGQGAAAAAIAHLL
jgi:hypothetical protein